MPAPPTPFLTDTRPTSPLDLSETLVERSPTNECYPKKIHKHEEIGIKRQEEVIHSNSNSNSEYKSNTQLEKKLLIIVTLPKHYNL